jgi:F420-0:gamma-glutamyl ligase
MKPGRELIVDPAVAAVTVVIAVAAVVTAAVVVVATAAVAAAEVVVVTEIVTSAPAAMTANRAGRQSKLFQLISELKGKGKDELALYASTSILAFFFCSASC